MPLTLDGLPLPDDLLWVDEYLDDRIAQASTYTLGGVLIVEESTQLAGQPVTLGSKDERSGWITKATLDALRTQANLAGASHTLVLPDGRSFAVGFRRPAFTATPIINLRAPGETDVYAVQINLLKL